MTFSVEQRSAIEEAVARGSLVARRGAYAADWTPEEAASWLIEEAAGLPVDRPLPEHEEGECDHCDFLRALTLLGAELP